jgi:hypothetical protein
MNLPLVFITANYPWIKVLLKILNVSIKYITKYDEVSIQEFPLKKLHMA